MAEITYIDVPPEMSKPVSFTIDMGKLKLGGMLHVAILQSDAELHYPDLQVFEVTEKKHTIVFSPPNPGIYTFTIKYNHKKVAGSPLELNLNPPDGKLISIVKRPGGKIKAGQPINIRFDSFLGGRGEFTAECSGKEAGDIAVSIMREGISNVYGIKFLPPQDDVYTLKAFYSSTVVLGSPYTIDLIPVRPDLVKCTNITLPEERDGPLEMDVCTTGCGTAKLTSTLSNSAGDRFPVKIDKVPPDNYHLTVEEPPKDGTITLDVKYGGKHVKGSPFIFPEKEEESCEVEILLEATAPDPDNVKVGEIHKPETAGNDKQVWVDADCSEAGPGVLTAECLRKNSEVKPTDVTVEELESKGNYRVKFDAKDHDSYTLSLLFDGKAIPGGLFEMDILQPPNSSKVKFGELHTPDTIGSEDAWIDLDCSEAGHGEVQANCSSNNEDYPVDLSALDSSNHYRAKFTPNHPDIYKLSLLFAGQPVPGGILEVSIPAPDPTKVKRGDLHVPEFAGDEPGWMDVDCSTAGYGTLTATCTGKKNEEDSVNVSVEELGPNASYRVKFIPKYPDVYILSLFFSGEAVPDGSFEVEIFPKPDPTKVKLGDLHVPEFGGGDDVVWLDLDCSEAGLGALTAECVRKNGAEDVEVSMVEISPKGNCRVKFTPANPDVYTLSLFFSKEPVPGGIFEMNILQRPDATKVKVGDLHTPEFAGDEPLWIDVDCSEAGTGEVTAEWNGRRAGSLEVSVETLSPKGRYRLTFPASHPDFYSLYLLFDGKYIPQGVFVRDVLQRPDPTKVTLGHLHTPEFAGSEPLWIDVDSSEAGMGELTAEWSGRDTGPLEVSVEELDPQGKYKLKFPADHPNVYTLLLFFGGQPVPGGIFEMDILQRPDATKVKLGDLHTPEFAGDEPLWIDVDCSEAGTGELTAEWNGKTTGPLEFAKEDLGLKGESRMKFPADHPDVYTLSLFFAGEPVPGGSFEMDILPRPDATKVKLGDLHTPEFAGDEPLWIDVDCSEAGTGELTAEWSGRDTGPVEVVKEELEPKGKYRNRMKFPANNPDVFTLSLFFAGEPVPGGSYEMNVLPRPDPEKVKIGDLHTPEFAGDEPLWIDVDCSEAGTGELTAEWNGSDAGPLEVSMEELDPQGKYRMKFPADHPDVYTLSLLFGRQPVPGGSFVMDVLQRPDPSKVKLGDLHVREFAGDESVWLEVDCSEAGHGVATAQCVRKTDDNAVEVTIQDSTYKGSYLVKFIPSNPAVYTLSLFFGGKAIPGGSFEIDIFARPDAAKVKLLGDLHIPESAGEEDVWIDVDCSEAGLGELTAECKGKNEERYTEIIPEVLDSKDNYRIKFTPNCADVYTLSLFFSGESVPNGWFEINLLPKSCAKLVRHLGTFIPDDIGEPVILKLDASKAGPGTMRGRVNGVTQAGTVSSRVDLIDEDDVIYHLLFIPEGADTYNVDVYWSDESIPGSPIYVKIIYPAEVILDDLVHPQDVNHPVQVSVDTGSAGPGVLTASCSGVESGPHDVEVVQDSSVPTKYTVYFHPTIPDLFSLRVYFSDVEVKQSPIEVDLRPPPSPQPVEEHSTMTPLENRPVVVYRVPDDEDEGVDNEREKHNGEPGSKFPSKLQLYVGEHMSLVIDSDDGELTASANGEETGEAMISVHSADSRGTYQVKFQPNQPDMYTIDIRLSDTHIPGSPYIIECLEREDTTIKEDSSEEETGKMSLVVPTRMQMYIGDPMILLLDDIEGEIGDLVTSAVGEHTGECSITTHTTEEKGSYRIEFRPTELDTYTVEVYHFNSHVPGSPFIIDFIERDSEQNEPEKPASPANSLDTIVVIDEAIPVHPIHKPYLIECVGWDDLKEVMAYAVHDESCTRDSLRIRKRRGKKPMLVFYPQKLGLHVVYIKQGSKEIDGSPFRLRIVKSACRIMSIPEKAYVDDLVEIKIDASEAGEGDLHILATVPVGGKGTSFSHADSGQGVYTIMFTPKVTGRHKIDVKWAGETIPESPVFVNILEPPDEIQRAKHAASKVFVVNEENANSKSSHFYLNRNHFSVNTEEAGTGELTLKSQGPTNPKINIYKEDEGLYDCHVKPTVPGKYEISILWNGIPIPGNPYKIDFMADKMYIINNLDLDIENFVLQQPWNFFVNCGSNEGSLKVSATPMEAAIIDVNLLENNIYSVKITPQVSGNHAISIKFADRHVLQSPYHVQFEALDHPIIEGKMSRLSDLNFIINSTDSTLAIPSESLDEFPTAELSNVKAGGPGLLEGVVGQEGNFTIDTESAGEGKLEVSVRGPKGTFHTRVRRHPDNDRTLLARYDPTHIGKYTISVLWCEKHIEGSPFVVDIRGQEQNSG